MGETFRPMKKGVAFPMKDLMQMLMKNYGMSQNVVLANLLMKWPDIVGFKLSQLTCPLKLTFERGKKNAGTLVVMISNPAIGVELQIINHVIIERINIYSGYAVVSKIKIAVAPNAKLGADAKVSGNERRLSVQQKNTHQQKWEWKLSPGEKDALTQVAGNTADEQLKQVLGSLMGSIFKVKK
jgi:hypothetical protein